MRDGYLRGELPLQTTQRQVDVLAAFVATGGSIHDAAELVIRDAFVFTGACVMPQPELLVGAAAPLFDDAGNITDPELRARLVELLEGLCLWSMRIDVRRRAA